MIHRFPSKQAAHSQKTFVSNMTTKRRITNKSPFKDVYPLINADTLMTNICNVVREIFAIIVSVMVIQTKQFINFSSHAKILTMFQNRDKLVQNFWIMMMRRRKLIGKQNMVHSYWVVASFDYNASISQLVRLRPISATAGSKVVSKVYQWWHRGFFVIGVFGYLNLCLPNLKVTDLISCGFFCHTLWLTKIKGNLHVVPFFVCKCLLIMTGSYNYRGHECTSSVS